MHGVSQLATENVTSPSVTEKETEGRALDLIKIVVPLALVGFLSHIPTVVTGFVCGQLNSTVKQSAASLAMSTCNYIGISFILGIITAVECIGSQAAGAGRRGCLGVTTARTIVICLVLSCYLAVIWLFSERLFNLTTSTKPDVDHVAGGMMRSYAVMLPVFCVDLTLTRYAIILGYVVEVVLIRFGAIVVQVGLAVVLVFTFDWELIGAMAALMSSEVLAAIATVILIRKFGSLSDITDNLNYNAFRGWWGILKLGGPGIAMIVAESIFIELTLLLLSKSDIDHYDAFLQLLQYHQFYFHLYHGLTTAGAIITGKGLGKSDPGRTRRDVITFSWFSAGCGVAFSLITLVLRYQIAYLLSSTSEVRDILEVLVPVYCVYLVLDCAQISISGVLRGMGKQVTGAAIYLVTLCGVGVLTAFLLNKVMTSPGHAAWIALSVGAGLALVGLVVTIARTDWVKETERAVQRLGLVDRRNIRMKELRGVETQQIEFNPFTYEILDHEKAPLFNREADGNKSDKEVRITLLFSGISVLILFIGLICFIIFRQ